MEKAQERERLREQLRHPQLQQPQQPHLRQQLQQQRRRLRFGRSSSHMEWACRQEWAPHPQAVEVDRPEVAEVAEVHQAEVAEVHQVEAAQVRHHED